MMALREADTLFAFVHAPTARHEGGINRNADGRDPGGPTNRGLSARLWRVIRRSPRYRELRDWPADVLALDEAQVSHVLRREFYERLGVGRLARLPGLLDAAPQLVRQIHDINVQHGALHAGEWLQRALNDLAGAGLAVDGRIGPRTRAAVAAALVAGRIDAVNDAIVAARLAYMRRLANWPAARNGWTRRAASYRVPRVADSGNKT
jgi:lysozyme family protein